MIEMRQYSSEARILALKMTGRVGPRTFESLLGRFGTIDEIYMAEEDQLIEIDGIGPGRSAAIAMAGEYLDPAQNIIENLEAFDIKTSIFSDKTYPGLLKELNDPPPLIFYQGKLPDRDEKCVAIIGSQDISEEGIGDAVELASRLAQKGISIVGGLARGIDTAGHIGALKSDGKTYAALPCGINNIHPEENSGLAKQITANGGLISEYIPDASVNTGRLMSRNRLIVGLSHAVIIGEVSPQSVGTLDAAFCCQQLGKLLFALVGKNNHHYEKLLEYGAIPLTNIEEYELIIKSLV